MFGERGAPFFSAISAQIAPLLKIIDRCCFINCLFELDLRLFPNCAKLNRLQPWLTTFTICKYADILLHELAYTPQTHRSKYMKRTFALWFIDYVSPLGGSLQEKNAFIKKIVCKLEPTTSKTGKQCAPSNFAIRAPK